MNATEAVRDDQLDERTLKDEHVDVSIATQSGLEIFPFDPKPEQIRIEDIAHATAMKCRFTGHTKFHYSVAQHSFLAAYLADTRGFSREVQQWALLHDATEAYLPDVASPLKRSLWVEHSNGTQVSFKSAERYLQACIMTRFGLPTEEPEEIKILDGGLYRAEKWALMPEVKGFETPQPPEDAPVIAPLTPERACEIFAHWAWALELK